MSTMMIDEWVEPDFHQINLDIETHLKQERGYKLDAGEYHPLHLNINNVLELTHLICVTNITDATSVDLISTPKDAPSALPVLSAIPSPRPQTSNPHPPSPLIRVIEKKP